VGGELVRDGCGCVPPLLERKVAINAAVPYPPISQVVSASHCCVVAMTGGLQIRKAKTASAAT
jgi:hypothetical protein